MSSTHFYPSHTGTDDEAVRGRASLRSIAANVDLSPEIRSRASSALLLATIPGRGSAAAIRAALSDMVDERSALVHQG